MKRFSNLSAQELMDHIKKVTKHRNLKDFDVFIEEQTMTIVVVHTKTYEGEGIEASRIYGR